MAGRCEVVQGNSLQPLAWQEMQKEWIFFPQESLSQTQESKLIEWILIQDALGRPPTQSQIKHRGAITETLRVSTVLPLR